MGEISPAPMVASAQGGLPDWVMVAGAVCGCVVLLAGLWLIRRGREGGHTPLSRLTAGICLMLLGYHVVAWTAPFGATMLRVPPDRWWVVVGVVVVAFAGSGLAELFERRHPIETA
jgi:hypothetical protein